MTSNRMAKRVLLVAGIVIGFCIILVVAAVLYFYLSGGMWPGTHTDPSHVL